MMKAKLCNCRISFQLKKHEPDFMSQYEAIGFWFKQTCKYTSVLAHYKSEAQPGIFHGTGGSLE